MRRETIYSHLFKLLGEAVVVNPKLGKEKLILELCIRPLELVLSLGGGPASPLDQGPKYCIVLKKAEKLEIVYEKQCVISWEHIKTQ
jgi:hypothetical protein